MFEKEAEEYMKDKFRTTSVTGYQSMKTAFQKGAEFGYNKANEWHYVKDGDLPKTKKRVLVLLKDVEEPILDYYRQDKLWNYALENEVIAWKEIVPPSLDKEKKMKEKHIFGKRTNKGNKVPADKVLKETFGVVNKGCDSQQVVDFIRKTTGHQIKEIKENAD